MIETVKVVSAHGNMARVTLERSTACGECGKCLAGKRNMTITADAVNDIGAKPGDNVVAEMSLSGVMSASIIMYGIPLIAFFVGIFIGYFYLPGLIALRNDACALISGFGLLALSYLPIKICDKKGLFRERYHITLKEII